MSRFVLGFFLPLVFVGCSEYGFRYAPKSQDIASPIFADYRVSGDNVDILVDTDGLRLRQISIAAPDGKTVDPTSINYPLFRPELMGGVEDEIYSPDLAQGPTVAHFDKKAIGPDPWSVNMKVQAMPYEGIRVGG